MEPTVVLPLPVPLVPTTHVRSTLLCASIQTLRARGHHDAYLAALTPAQREDAMALTAGSWLPLERAELHYRACDRIQIDQVERFDMGTEVARRIQQSVLNVLVRLSKQAGTTPWSVVSMANKLREQTWRGGGIRVLKTGPKDASVEWLLQPCSKSLHFRVGFQGILRGLFELFCRRAYLSEERHDDDTLVMTASWA